MTIEEAIRQKLGEDTRVASLVGTRIYPGVIPADDAPSPWIFFLLTEEVPGEEIGANDWKVAMIELEIFAETYSGMAAVKSAARRALNCKLAGSIYRGLWTGGSASPVEGGFNATEKFTYKRTRRGVVEGDGIFPTDGAGSFLLT